MYKERDKRLKALGFSYDEYLKSNHWKLVRKHVYETRSCRCQFCDVGNSELHIHHKTYKDLFNESQDQLVLLCDSCHRLCHQIARETGDLFVATDQAEQRTKDPSIFDKTVYGFEEIFNGKNPKSRVTRRQVAVEKQKIRKNKRRKPRMDEVQRKHIQHIGLFEGPIAAINKVISWVQEIHKDSRMLVSEDFKGLPYGQHAWRDYQKMLVNQKESGSFR